MNIKKYKLKRKGEKEAKQVPEKDKTPLYIRIIPILIPVIIISYILYVNFLPFGYSETFTVDVGAKDDVFSSKDIYLKDLTRQERISERIADDGDTTYRYMKGSRPIYFILSPEVRLDDETKISVELRFKADSDLYITTTDYKHYDWQPLYIASFAPVKQFENISIFGKENKNYEDYDNVNDWILKNIPEHSRICLYDYELSNDVLINEDIEYKNEHTEINQTFRGTHTFFVYLKDNLNLSIGKQDLNWYVGEDEYLVELYDINDNLIFSDIIMDDGVFEATKEKIPQHKSFFVDGIEEGTYKLKLTDLKGENRYDDSTITNIRINTNRIITSGQILPLSPSDLFFNLNQNTTLRFYAWYRGGIQNTTISGAENKIIEINETLLGEWVPVNFTRGSYRMSIESNLRISGTNFAFSNDSYFYPYNYDIDNEDCSWIMISDYDVVEVEEDGWVTARKAFDGSEIKLYKDQIVFGLKKEDDEDVMIDKIKVNVRQ